MISITEWIARLFGRNIASGTEAIAANNEPFGLYVRELAFMSCVNLISGALSKCEFRTYSGGKEVNGQEYYLWNVSPNKNQDSAAFLNKLLYKLYTENSALVIDAGSAGLLVADSYDRREYALRDDIFSSVKIGDYEYYDTFESNDVLFFSLFGDNVKTHINGLYEEYRKIIAAGVKGYRKSRGTKGTLEVDALQMGNKSFNKAYEDAKNEAFKAFAEADNAVLPLYKGIKFEELGTKTYANETTRDIRAMIDDITDYTARILTIPASLVNGKVENVDTAIDQLITFCIDPLVKNLTAEINRKRYGYNGFIRGDRLEIDTHKIRHIDALSCAAGIDKLIASGVSSVNDIRRLIGEPRINEEWADRHFITKNYENSDGMGGKDD